MVEIDWTDLVLLLIGLFALAGYYKGWWKEAITTIFLTFLVILSLVPALAQLFIDLINFIIAAIWTFLSELNLTDVTNALEATLGLNTSGGPPQLDASDGHTWIVILIIFLALATLIGRYSLPGWNRDEKEYKGYVVTRRASWYGALLGGVNGWLIISLVRAYLNESNLPGGVGPTATTAPGSVRVQATDVPLASIVDSFLPWLFIALAILILIAATRSRIGIVKDKDGFRKVEYKPPLGYKKYNVTPSKD